jgi:magnesium chelatase family protein
VCRLAGRPLGEQTGPGADRLRSWGQFVSGDEAPEFASGVLDALRQPPASGHVTIARSGGTARYPARFLLVLATKDFPGALNELGLMACGDLR